MPFIKDNLIRLKEKTQNILVGLVVFLKKISPYKSSSGQAWPNKFQWKNFFKILSKPEKYLFWFFIFLIVISSAKIRR